MNILGVLKGVFSYWTIAIVCALLAFASLPFLQGTNNSQESCVYTIQGKEGTYVRNGSQYEIYDSVKHPDVEDTYIMRRWGQRIEYFVNKPNWSFWGEDCVLTQEAIFTFIAGYLISFTILFSFLGIIRISIKNLFTYANRISDKNYK